MKTLIIGYEPTQLSLIRQTMSRLQGGNQNVKVVAIDMELEWSLQDEGIPFVSSLTFGRGERLQNIGYTEKLVTDTVTSALNLIQYRGVSFGAIFAYPLHVYIAKWLYFKDIIDAIIRNEKPDRVLVCAPFFSPPIEKDTFLHFENEAPVSSAVAVCNEHRIGCETIGCPEMTSLRKRANLKELVIETGLAMFNVCMKFAQKKNVIRVLASEYWHHLDGLFAELPESSLVLYDRKESGNIPFRTILKNKIRFMHGPVNLDNASTRKVIDAKDHLLGIWEKQKGRLSSMNWQHGRYDMSQVIASALDLMMIHQLHPLLIETERIFHLLEDVDPHVVLLRASVSGQAHFSIFAQAAKHLEIPGIEIQHGLEIFAPGSISRNHATEYIALYGDLIRREMEKYVPHMPKSMVVGSPYFDALYHDRVKMKRDDKEELVCIAPDVSMCAVYDTYDAYEFFRSTAQAARESGLRVRVKLRGSRRQPFYLGVIDRAFEGDGYEISKQGNIIDACRKARIAVSCYSTAVLELMQLGIPTVMASLSTLEAYFIPFHFGLYECEGALKIAGTTEELSRSFRELSTNQTTRDLQVKKAFDFLSHQYAFDGQSARRLSSMILSVLGRSGDHDDR